MWPVLRLFGFHTPFSDNARALGGIWATAQMGVLRKIPPKFPPQRRRSLALGAPVCLRAALRPDPRESEQGLWVNSRRAIVRGTKRVWGVGWGGG